MIETKDAFDPVTDEYGDLYAEFYAGMKEILGAEVYVDGRIRRVLDVGGGGKPAEDLFCEEVVQQLELFVSNDISFSMLARNKVPMRVNSDAYAPPFRPRSFDTILVYGCIHHVGHAKYRNRLERVKTFLNGISELLTEDGYVYFEEPTLPFFFEQAERFALFPLILRILRKPAVLIYMYRSSELQRLLEETFDCEVLQYKTTGQVMGSPWKTSSPFLFFKWFRIPVLFIPYRYLLCRARLKRS